MMKKIALIKALAALLIGGIFMGYVPVYADEVNPIATQTQAQLLFPVQVEETDLSGSRRIVRVYELTEYEDPANIRSESFERDGFYFELSEITRNRLERLSVKNHVEVITIESASQNLSDILAYLDDSIQFESEDGYSGMLVLDLSSVTTEIAGHNRQSYTVREYRSFPNLSSPDISLIPRTITARGHTLTLADVRWEGGNSDAIDFERIASTFTANAVYTGTGSRSVVSGYVTTAEFRGEVARINEGDNTFTVTFIGRPLYVEEPEWTIDSIAAYIADLEGTLSDMRYAETGTRSTREREPMGINWHLVMGVLAVLGAVGAGVYLLFLRGNVKVYNCVEDENYAYLGKTRISKNNPVIDLSPFTERARTAKFIIELGRWTASHLNGTDITLNYGGITFQHTVAYEKGQKKYEIKPDF